MRLLIDTNIFIFIATDNDSLSRDVKAMLDDYGNQIFISAESLRELIVAYRNKGIGRKYWKSEIEMIRSISEKYYITVPPITQKHMGTYAHLTINEAMGHKDPSDHVIIAHAITDKLTLISSDTRFPFYREQGLDLVANER